MGRVRTEPSLERLVQPVTEESPTLGEVRSRAGGLYSPERGPGHGGAREDDGFALCEHALREAGVDGDRRVAGFFVPGRIEVLGKHTDYAGGRSLLAALDRGFCVLASPRPDRTVTVIDAAVGEYARFAIGSGARPEAVTGSEEGWRIYPRTVVQRLARNFPRMTGADIAFISDLPPAAGMSSSSALTISIALALISCGALAKAGAFRRSVQNREELADYLAAVEGGRGYGELCGDAGVGTRGGSQDHTAILNSREGELVQFGYFPVRLERRLAFPDDLTFVVGSSGVAAVKTGDALETYNHAASRAARLVELWQSETGRDEGTLGEILAMGPDTIERLRKLIRTAPSARASAGALEARLEQFAAEALEIVPGAGDAFAASDFSAFGALVDRSQRLAEATLQNQIAETIHLARSARTQGAVAASAFGAGFGGSVWALIESRRAEVFTHEWQASFTASFPERETQAEFFTTRPARAATRWM